MIFTGNANPGIGLHCASIWAPRSVGSMSAASQTARCPLKSRKTCVPATPLLFSHLRPHQRQPDGTHHHGGRAQARLGGEYLRGYSVFWLRATRSPSPLKPGADQRQGGGQHAASRWAWRACSPWTCTPTRSRAFLIFRSTTFTPPGVAGRPARQKPLPNLLVVSPDVGGVVRARALAKQLDCDMAIIDKRRPRANVSEVMHVIGDIEAVTASSWTTWWTPLEPW
jgi:hypothetical protein